MPAAKIRWDQAAKRRHVKARHGVPGTSVHGAQVPGTIPVLKGRNRRKDQLLSGSIPWSIQIHNTRDIQVNTGASGKNNTIPQTALVMIGHSNSSHTSTASTAIAPIPSPYPIYIAPRKYPCSR